MNGSIEIMIGISTVSFSARESDYAIPYNPVIFGVLFLTLHENFLPLA